MSVYEASITNPKKQLEFYKQLSEQLQQENKKYKEVIDKIDNIISLIDELRKDTGGYPSDYIDKLLDILKEVKL